MKIQIKLNEEILDVSNLAIKNYAEDLSNKKELLSKSEVDFSSIKYLQGDKNILKLTFDNQMAEELN